jgi:hypothetical protein
MLKKQPLFLSFEMTGLNDRPPPGNCLRKLCATNFPCLRNFFAGTAKFTPGEEKETKGDEMILMTLLSLFLLNPVGHL